MTIPTFITPATDPCVLAQHWTLAQELATRLVKLSGDLPYGLKVISGYRTCAQEQELGAQGRPVPRDAQGNVDCSKSFHTVCPSRAADVMPDVAVTDSVKAELGRAATFAGLEWGGGSPVDPGTGIPSDWNHLQLMGAR